MSTENSNTSKALLLSGLVAGALIGAYLYKNQTGSQKEKLNKTLKDLQAIAGDLKTRLLTASQEGLDATKTAIQQAKEKVK